MHKGKTISTRFSFLKLLYEVESFHNLKMSGYLLRAAHFICIIAPVRQIAHFTIQ